MDIELKRALAPFRRKLAAEAALRSAIAGGVIALPVWAVLAVFCRAQGMEWPVYRAMAAAWALLAALFYLLKYRPTLERIAARIDETGQQDRISTMAAFLDQDGVLYRLQREDALKRLSGLSPSIIRVSFSIPAAIVCACLAAMIAVMPALPDSVFGRTPGAEQPESEEAVLLRGKIEELRATIEGSELEESDKTELLAQVEALLAQMQAGQMDISALQEIRRLMDAMSETVVELTPRDTYAAAMLEFESLKALGEAIFNQNADVVTLVFDNMAYTLKEKQGMDQVNALMNLVYDINGSLAKPIRDNSQESLRQAMMALAGGLESAADMVYNKRDNTQVIETALYYAEESVREFLGVTGEEERYDPYADPKWQELSAKRRYSSAMSLPSIVQEELSPTQTEFVYHPSQADALSGYAPGEAGTDGVIQRIAAPQDETQDGTVPYGEVYGAYYADYLEDKSAGAIPQSLEETVEAYFNGI